MTPSPKNPPLPWAPFISYVDLADGQVIYEPWSPAPLAFTPVAASLPDLPDWRRGWGDLYGKTVRVTQIGRFFDDLLFANYYAELIEFAGQVIIECHAAWQSLWQRSFPQAQIVESGSLAARDGAAD